MFVEYEGHAGVQVSKMEFHTHTHTHTYIYIHTHRLGYGKISILYKKIKIKTIYIDICYLTNFLEKIDTTFMGI